MAKLNASLDSGLIDLVIDTAKNTVTITNTDTRGALFNVFAADGSGILVWSYTQAAGTQSTIAIPVIDNNGAAINWTVGNVPVKTGGTVQTITSPPWQLTMAA